MDQEELAELNIGQSLDDIANIDPRGYGVCKILYKGAREYTKNPLTMNAAKQLIKVVQNGDIVYIMTGFVLLPHKKAEMDGIVSSLLLCRALIKAFDCKPIIICQEENIQTVINTAPIIGLHLNHSIKEVLEYPFSMGVIPFTKNADLAPEQADKLIKEGLPKAVISIELPGENDYGHYHNATGKETTDLEAKMDILFLKLQKEGVLNISIGDLGNELGMGAIKNHVEQYIPYAKKGSTNCTCKGGIAAKVAAQHIITATVSDWGCYGMIAAIAFLKKNIEIMHTEEMEKEVMISCSRSGMVDMYGSLDPAIDGFGPKLNMNIVSLMRECITYALKLQTTCKTWFDKTIELKYFQKN